MKFNDQNLKNEIFVRIDHTSQNYLFPINFSVVETVVVCQKLIHVYAFMFLLYKVTNLTLYMYLFINVCYTCMPFIYVDVHLKTILAVTLFVPEARG